MLPSSLPWPEKYRPSTLAALLSQDAAKSLAQKTVQTGHPPHMLLYGPPGTGKTTMALALAKELFGPHYRRRVLELNASDDRGIDIVRTKIKQFAQISVKAPLEGYPSPPIKIIILDEVDFMTRDAQTALRRIMETESATTSFCLMCNYVSNIIEPIKSRCAVFRFQPIAIAAAVDRLQEICSNEGVETTSETMQHLVEQCDGDMRQAITVLESASVISGRNQVEKKTVDGILNVIPVVLVEKIVAVCQGNEPAEMQQLAEDIAGQGYPIDKVLQKVLVAIVMDSRISNAGKSEIVLKIGEAETHLAEGGDPFLQLLDLFCVMGHKLFI